MNKPSESDPLALVQQISTESIRRRIADQDSQRRALAAQLRAASARERRAPKSKSSERDHHVD
jgi:hypothetical protein